MVPPGMSGTLGIISLPPPRLLVPHDHLYSGMAIGGVPC